MIFSAALHIWRRDPGQLTQCAAVDADCIIQCFGRLIHHAALNAHACRVDQKTHFGFFRLQLIFNYLYAGVIGKIRYNRDYLYAVQR